jgi:hypothetical protein
VSGSADDAEADDADIIVPSSGDCCYTALLCI